jgi:hypothetical protein
MISKRYRVVITSIIAPAYSIMLAQDNGVDFSVKNVSEIRNNDDIEKKD